MKAICVDDEVLTMEYTVEQCREIGALEDVRGFTRARDALEIGRAHV